MTQEWISSFGFVACLRFFTLSFLVLIGIAACNQDTSHKVRLYVYPDATGKHALFVNDQPTANLHKERGSGPVSGDIYESYYIVKSLEPQFRLEIKTGDTTVYQKSVDPGMYVVNLSGDQLIWFAETAYGRPLESNAQFLEQGKLGVYKISQKSGGVVFAFDQEPPESIRSRRGSAKATDFFILGTYTDKGLALRKSLMAHSQAQRKPEQPFRVLTDEESRKMLETMKEAGATSKGQ